MAIDEALRLAPLAMIVGFLLEPYLVEWWLRRNT